MTKWIRKRHGMSFLNLIILIVLVGCVTSFSVTNLYKFIEFSRSMEALATCKNLSDALNFCKMSRLTYQGCANNNAQIDEISKTLDRHFDYSFENLNREEFMIVATRNLLHGGDGGSSIIYKQTKSNIMKSGTGIYILIQ